MLVLHLLPLFPAVAGWYCSSISALALAWAAVGRHRLSVACAVLLVTVSASLLGVSVPLALVGWLAVSVVSLQAWTALECTVLKLLGARPLSRLERERLRADLLPDRRPPAPQGSASKSSRRRLMFVQQDGRTSIAVSPSIGHPSADAVAEGNAEAEAEDRGEAGAEAGSHARADSKAGAARGFALAGFATGDLEVLVVDAPRPWFGRGLRSVLLSSALFDLLDDRALAGFLAQTAAPAWTAGVAGEWMVWLGNLPLVASWSVSRLLARLGRVLAVVFGASLVLPLLLWPTGFTVVAGYVFGAMIVGLFGAVLLSSGFAAAGLGLVAGWPVVGGLRALLAWERRRTEARADHATIQAGLGWPLLEALETLALATSLPGPGGVFGLLCQPGAPFAERADRVWKTLSDA